MEFTKALVEHVKNSDALFSINGATWKYVFVRIPTEKLHVEELMYGKIFRSNNGPELLRKMEQFCVLVNNVPYNCEYLVDVAREDSAENDFFKNTFGDVIEEFEGKVSGKLIARLESLSDEELVPDENERNEIANPERLARFMRDLVVSGVAPKFDIGCVLYDSDHEKTAINYLLYGEYAVDNVCDSVVSGSRWEEKRRSFFVYKAEKAYFEANKDNLSSEDIVIRDIKNALNEALALGAKNVTLYVDGDDDMLSPSVRNAYPDFSIANKELEIKASPSIPVCAGTGKISHWSVKVENVVLRNRYSNRREDFLQNFPITKIKRISYRKKDLYRRA